MKSSIAKGFLLLGAGVVLVGCGKEVPESGGLPAYLEADAVEMASSEAGYLAELPMRRGQTVKAGDVLFRLEAEPLERERAAAADRVAAAELRAEDAMLGEREETIRKLKADRAGAAAARELAQTEFTRIQSLAKSNAVARDQLDVAQASLTQNEQQLIALDAQLALAEKGQRPLQIDALKADVRALESSEATAVWRAAQLEQTALTAAIIEDTLYEPGEWVPAGRPVVVLRRLTDLRARFFVSPEVAAKLKLGDVVEVRLPGEAGIVDATIIRVADQAEFTPPVIYSREQSERLVLMIEAQLEEADAAKLHPGLPVTVELP